MDTSIHVGYPYSGYLRGYGTCTCIIFIQRIEDEYHTIRTHRYSLTSLQIGAYIEGQREGMYKFFV